MSPKTKGRVNYGRKIQLGLRFLALVGAIGSLFCAVVVKGAAAIIWIIRVGVSLQALGRCNYTKSVQAYRSYLTHSLRHSPSFSVLSH